MPPLPSLPSPSLNFTIHTKFIINSAPDTEILYKTKTFSQGTTTPFRQSICRVQSLRQLNVWEHIFLRLTCKGRGKDSSQPIANHACCSCSCHWHWQGFHCWNHLHFSCLVIFNTRTRVNPTMWSREWCSHERMQQRAKWQRFFPQRNSGRKVVGWWITSASREGRGESCSINMDWHDDPKVDSHGQIISCHASCKHAWRVQTKCLEKMTNRIYQS